MVVVRKPISHSMSTNTIRKSISIFNKLWLEKMKNKTININFFIIFFHFLEFWRLSNWHKWGGGKHPRAICHNVYSSWTWGEQWTCCGGNKPDIIMIGQHLTLGENKMASSHSRHGHEGQTLYCASMGQGRQLQLDFIDWIILLMTPMRKWAWPS